MLVKNILLIDDDEDELEIFTEALKKLTIEFQCQLVTNPSGASELLKEFIPDYVFIDYNMPLSNGVEVLSHLKKTKELKSARFVLYSNYINEVMAEKAFANGAFACIRKPNLTATLSSKLKEILIGSTA
jgi:CheY-like chemotaxis protein